MVDGSHKKASGRKGNFSIDEDIHLCNVYLAISDDPIAGINQKKDRVWERISELWNEGKNELRMRSTKSLQSRFSDLTYCIGKFRGALRQVEHLNPSGASEKDIHTLAKQHLQDDPTFTKKKLQFDHVWPILKDAEKWIDNGKSSTNPRQRNISRERFESDSHTSQSSRSVPFVVDLNADEDEQELYNEEIGQASRPIGIKKAKLKRKEENERTKLAKQIKDSNQELKELFEKSMLERNTFAAKHEEYASRKLAMQREREENKIMLTSMDSIRDPEGREYLRMKKAEIMDRRAHHSQQQQQQPPTPCGFGNFSNINQFQGGTHEIFNSSNFASSYYGASADHYRGTDGYGGFPHHGGNGGSSSSGVQGESQQFDDNNGAGTRSGYGWMGDHRRNDNNPSEY